MKTLKTECDRSGCERPALWRIGLGPAACGVHLSKMCLVRGATDVVIHRIDQ